MTPPLHLGNYESLLTAVMGLEPAPSPSEREITWCGTNRRLGIAKNALGQIEIFLVGPALKPRTRLLRDSLKHQEWFRADASGIPASRLLLPSLGHFEPVAAFLCTELLRAGVDSDVEHAFDATQAIIDLALQRLGLTSETLLGLVGELLLLRAMVLETPTKALDLVQAWKGHTRSDRDFQIDTVGVEVKTTTRTTSTHQMHGVRQTQAGHGVDGQDERRLFLVSIGIAPGSDGISLPDLVDSLITRIKQVGGPGAKAAVALLVSRIKSYGSEDGLGYDHDDPEARVTFSGRYGESFVRCYDMGDEAIRVFTESDLSNRPFVDGASLTFVLSLPDQVTGDINPTAGRANAARVVLAAAGWG